MMNREDMLSRHRSFCKERQKRIVSAERRSRHTAVNIEAQKVRQYHIDGDVVTSKKVDKCDYLVLNDEKKTAYFIELKGSKIQHAIKQLENSADMLRPELLGYQFFYRIVFSGSATHSVNGSAYLKWQKKYGKRKGIMVARMDRTSYEEQI